MNHFIIAGILSLVVTSADAQAPCSNLTGSARTNCFNATLQAAKQQALRIQQQIQAQQAAQRQAQQAAQQAQQQAQQRAQQEAQQRALQEAAQQQAQQQAALKAEQAAQQQAPQQASAVKNSSTQQSIQTAPQVPTPATATKSTAPVSQQANTTAATRNSSSVVWSSPYLGFTPTHTKDCVDFLEHDLHMSLPGGWFTYPEKLRSANVRGMPQVGDVAIIKVNSGTDVPYGHVAKVMNVTSTSITILEAGMIKGGGVDSRESTAPNLQAAEQQLNIMGFYRRQ